MTIRSLDELSAAARKAADEALDAALAAAPARLRGSLRDDLTAHLCDHLDADATAADVQRIAASLAPEGGEAASWLDRAGAGFVPKGMLGRIAATWWNPADERLLLPRAVGWGWDLNLGAVAVRLGLIEPDAESVPFTSTGDSAFRLAAAGRPGRSDRAALPGARPQPARPAARALDGHRTRRPLDQPAPGRGHRPHHRRGRRRIGGVGCDDRPSGPDPGGGAHRRHHGDVFGCGGDRPAHLGRSAEPPSHPCHAGLVDGRRGGGAGRPGSRRAGRRDRPRPAARALNNQSSASRSASRNARRRSALAHRRCCSSVTGSSWGTVTERPSASRATMAK